MSGSQCHLRLWYDIHEPNLAPPISEAQQATFDTGNEVGSLARERYPGGYMIRHDYRRIPHALAETQRLIEADATPALFESAFLHDGVLARIDVLERLPRGGWRIVEVKSSTRRKEEHILEAAVQLWVLRGAGLDIREAGVLTLDRDYIYDGIRLDLDALFKLHPVLDEANTLLDGVGSDVAEMQAMLTADSAPDIAPGAHCFKPYACGYYDHCIRDIPQPEHGIKELHRISSSRRERLEGMGISEIRDVPADFPLNPLQSVIRKAVIDDSDLVHGNLAGMLSAIKPPVRHLDFETFQPAIPRFAGTRPYDQIPFLFSVHTETDGASPEHIDYMHEGSDDPRPMLTERLLKALGDEGSICVYSGFERTQLNALAAAFPQHAAALEGIIARLVDLLPIVRSCYYHPDLHGSFSLKSVLPVVAPTLSYDDLDINDGWIASIRYARALASPNADDRRRTFDDLRAYCAQDTLAMVELRKTLTTLAHAGA